MPCLLRKRFNAEIEMSSSLSRASFAPSAPRYGALVRLLSPLSGFSILMTRAPKPASSNVAKGPASALVKSKTVRPAKGAWQWRWFRHSNLCCNLVQPLTVIFQARLLNSSVVISTGKNLRMISMFVVVCRDGATVVNAPPPASASGINN